MKRIFCRAIVVAVMAWPATGVAQGLSGRDIQGFIDEALSVGGGEVVLPPGRHLLSEPLVVRDAVKLRLVGLDAEETRLLADPEADKSFPLLVVEDAKGPVAISKLTLATAEPGASRREFADSPLIEVRGGDAGEASVTVERCLLERHAGVAIRLTGASGVAVEASSFMDVAGGAVVADADSKSVSVTDNRITRCGIDPIRVDKKAADTTVEGNEED
jgi:hypothetical protein